MVGKTELKITATKYGVKLSTVERDYAQNWLLKHLNEINMALKGGTGLRKVYFKEYRFSDDLDFTLLEKVGKGALTNKINKAIKKAKDESGINFTGITGLEESTTGYKFKVGLEISQAMNIQLDITAFDKEEVMLPVVERKINHIYSDDFYGTAKSYDIEEILIEKIRSIFQRGFPRDLYDAGFLFERGVKVNKEILEKKFKYRGIVINILQLEVQRERMRNAWIASLENQINPVPNFDLFFDRVLEELGKYEW
ncbi:MAG: nucleotidyl transferase AbiEii/AbiGii toxin family protein [Caldiserica bacterium]|nr:nucleotidyl transferase AbiEii/AbiGii toxin family protein [Caldisericota bacterium]